MLDITIRTAADVAVAIVCISLPVSICSVLNSGRILLKSKWVFYLWCGFFVSLGVNQFLGAVVWDLHDSTEITLKVISCILGIGSTLSSPFLVDELCSMHTESRRLKTTNKCLAEKVATLTETNDLKHFGPPG